MTRSTAFAAPTRRQALGLGIATTAIALASALDGAHTGARAQVRVPIREGEFNPVPIAIPEFISDDPRLGADIANIVAADLERSEMFKPLDRGGFIERIRDLNQTPRVADWKGVGADFLIVGRVSRQADGRIRVEYRLWDVTLGRPVDGQSVVIAPQHLRRLGHMTADRVYEKLTRERGYFDSHLVFVDETGPKNKRIKRLAIMDTDGQNVRLLTDGREITMTPRFSPVTQEITYVSYTAEQPRVLMMNLENGQRAVVGDFQGFTFAPRFSPDGQRIVMSHGTPDGNSSLLEMDLRSRQARRLTQVQGIDTGPCYAPDGRQIVFESDRSGNQQLYVMASDGSGLRRISNGEGRYSTPVWSPRGDYIAFTCQRGGRFLIGVLKPDGSGERILTDGYHNEGPTWAPNGRVLSFFREAQGAGGGPKIFTVDLTGRFEPRALPTPSFASDPAWSPLLK